MDIVTTSAAPSSDGVDVRTELRLKGRFDAHETEAFRTILTTLLADESRPADIAVHLGDVEFIDSTALAELVRGMKQCRDRDGDLVLSSPSAPVRVILELTKLDLAFTIV